MDIECGNASAGARVIVFNKNQPQSKNQLWYQDRQDNIHSALNSFLLQATSKNTTDAPCFIYTETGRSFLEDALVIAIGEICDWGNL